MGGSQYGIDPYHFRKPDPDPYQSQNSGAVKAQNKSMERRVEAWRLYSKWSRIGFRIRIHIKVKSRIWIRIRINVKDKSGSPS